MTAGPAISFRDVWKGFHRHSGRQLLRSHVSHWFSGRGRAEKFYALRGLSFEMQHGESVALVGANGAGKSTLLSLVAGLVGPDSGSLLVNGRVATLLELGSGFHPDLTGAENLRLNAALLGVGRAQMREIYDKIVEFAEIGEFMGEPLRTYSAGMTMRLAFSVAVHLDPDILLIDEVLAVGDHGFQKKCAEKILDFHRMGKTILCVSHESAIIQKLCPRALWLDHGELVLDGPIAEVCEAYEDRRSIQR